MDFPQRIFENGLFKCSFSKIYPPAMQVDIKGFSFKQSTSRAKVILVPQPHIIEEKEAIGKMSHKSIQSLSQAKWRCHYHIVFSPKH